MMLWDRGTKGSVRRVEIVATVQIVVNHKLCEILQMSLVRLKFLLQNGTLLEKICQSRHDNRVEHVNFQKEAIANMEPIERHTFR